jgi:hypothetical protein
VLRVKDHAPTPFPFVVFTFELVVEYIEEFRGVSIVKRLMAEGRAKEREFNPKI